MSIRVPLLELTVILILLPIFIYGQEDKKAGHVSGIVIDRTTQKPLPNVNLVILNTSFGTSSLQDGKFTIQDIPVGIYSIRASLLGYRSVIKSDVVIKAGKVTFLTIELEESPIESEEIIVTENYFSRHTGDAGSIHSLTMEEIRRASGSAEDVNRVIQSLPGIIFIGDHRNDIIVRGGSPIENLFLVNNIDVPNINHYGTFGATGGSISMVDVKYIEGVDVFTGGFNAKYGDRLSGVMSISLRQGNRERFQGIVDAGIGGFGIAGEGPLGSNGSWIISGRVSYLDLIKEALQMKTIPHYKDVFGKIDYELSPSTKLMILGFGGIDEVTTSPKEDEPLGFQGVSQNIYQFTVGAKLRQLLGKTGFAEATVSQTRNKFDTRLLNLTDRTTEYDYSNISREKETVFKVDGIISLERRSQIELGAGVRLLNFDHNIFAKPDTIRTFDTSKIYVFSLDYKRKSTTVKSFGYGNYSYSIGNISLDAGVRYDYFSMMKYAHLFSPRLSIMWKLNEITTFNFATGIFQQFPSLPWVTSQEINRSLLPMRCYHYVLGFERLLAVDTRISIESYYKYYDRYPVSNQNKTMVMIDAAAGFTENVADTLLDGGLAKSYGIDIFIQKKLMKQLYGLLSYSLSQTKVKALLGDWRAGAFDNRHVITISGGYVFDEHWQVGAKFRFATGRAYTPINEQLSYQLNQPVLDLEHPYSKRYPDYFRIDLRIDRRDHIGSISIVSYLEFQNATNRKNVFFHMWDNRKRELRTVYQWALLPTGGFRVEF